MASKHNIMPLKTFDFVENKNPKRAELSFGWKHHSANVPVGTAGKHWEGITQEASSLWCPAALGHVRPGRWGGWAGRKPGLHCKL